MNSEVISDMKVAIIPARGGSKRLPGKNIMFFAGKPMIAWTIQAAIESCLFDDILVSTDCEQIAEVALHYGAKIPGLRPKNLASDKATTNDVISYVVESYERINGCSVNVIALLQPTSPLRTGIHITRAFELMVDSNVSGVVSVCPVEYPIELCGKLGSDLKLKGFFDAEILSQPRSLDCTYRLNGAIYLFRRQFVGRITDIYEEDSLAYVMLSRDSVDVDTRDDFEIAEYFLKKKLAVDG